MALRIRVPFLVDVALVSDDAQMAWLNNEPALDRRLSGRGGWINRMVSGKAESLRVDSSRLLPVFEPRDDCTRKADQKAARETLTRLAQDPEPFDRHLVATLGAYVAGLDPDLPVGVAVQQIVGGLFDTSYRASEESYDAARVMAATLSACPVTMLRALWWKVSGRLEESKRLILRLARGKPVVVHGTAIAMHNIVDSLERMREAIRRDGPWHATPAEAAAEALAAPPRLLREGAREPSSPCPFSAGTLVVFQLKKMHEGSDDNSLAFSEAQWSQCPAYAIVPRLLEDVWRAAVLAQSRRGCPAPPGSWAYRVLAAAFRIGRGLCVPIMALGTRAFVWINRYVPWYRFPWPIGFLNLAALRRVLRAQNLHDTSILPSSGDAPAPDATPDVLRWRTADGSFNDLQDVTMGRAGTRFGHNVPLGQACPDAGALLDPNPRRVSETLLKRVTFTRVEGLNVLVPAWIQFQVHDWFSHGDNDPADPFVVDVDDQDWSGQRPMRISRTRRDPTRADQPPREPPTFINTVTHWWDASQLYGSDVATQRRVRSGRDGKLTVTAQGRIPTDARGIEITGFTENWWLGLSLFHQLFVLEHNAICDRLRAEYPVWGDEQLFQVSRLVNAALIAKIHDVEWVPAVLANPTTVRGLRASWWGLLGEWVAKNLGRFHESDMWGGILGSDTDQFTAPYAITEEFVSVYRMHPFMMPDDFHVYSAQSSARLATLPLRNILHGDARAVVEGHDMADLLYSFGIARPGALTLGNYSNVFRGLEATPGSFIDLATVDILRDRERGVPRYNGFRRLLHLPPVRSFDELNAEWAGRLREVYGTNEDGSDRVDRIDLLVGMLAETKPPGFGFGDTTFRIFLLMNSRRLKSDRFYTKDYRPAVYTETGLEWIDGNDLPSVLLRHHPVLRPVLERLRKEKRNVFTPWAPTP